MTRLIFILKTFFYYFKANLLVALSVAICTAVLTGALIIGDSVRFSLEQSTFYRLGNTSHLISSNDRFFRQELAGDLARNGKVGAAPLLILEGMGITEGGKARVNKIQINGIDSTFEKISGSLFFSGLEGNDVIISSNLAERLNLKKGDEFLLRIKKASLIPLNAPFVSDAETSVSFRAKVKGIADRNNLGFFNLKNSQTAPYNIFMSLSRLNELMKFEGKANNILISQTSSGTDLESTLQESFTPRDAGLQVKDIPLTQEKEIVSDRVFMDKAIIKAFQKFAGSYDVLTYFVNAIQHSGYTTPYSFVSALDDENLKNNEIILNTWAASDIAAKPGDSIRLKYYFVGPLRQLTEKQDYFVVKKIIPLEGRFSDRDLMPSLPGLADAKSCREWEAGVPIDLNAIRDKDEDYWNRYKGTPKAFISMEKAQQIWANRFGNYTALRIPVNNFTDKEYRHLFSTSVKPSDLGINLISIRQNGLTAAKNGVDFSQLFLGLSFFLLLSAIILISLLFLLNLENRQTQLGTLSIIGFTPKQQRKMLVQEGLFISFFGALIGLVLTIIYTKIIFYALNTLWWAVVRTSVLELKIFPGTLITGLIITVIISLGAILFSVNRSFKKQAVEMQRQQEESFSGKSWKIKKVLMILSLGIAILIAVFQVFVRKTADPALFFFSGSLILLGLLLRTDLQFRKRRGKLYNDLSQKTFIHRNTSHNIGRSITVVILFAIGTFLVISTGANRQDTLIANDNKTSGTGGFLYFAETTIPVLYDINDKGQRTKAGFEESFSGVQFHRMNGDDASCLNLNKVTNPSILGGNPKILENRFSFSSKVSDLSVKDPWMALDSDTVSETSISAFQPVRTSSRHIIPAIADQTVIQWSLGKEIGDTLFYRNEKGDTLGLRLIAGLSPSIFQGYILISDRNFQKNYPSVSGSSIFLIDGPEKRSKEIGEELRNVYRDNGWEMTTTTERLMEFNSVTNTYLSIFLSLGALALILGTVGLAIVLARSIFERRSEIALLQALGFTRNQIWRSLTREYLTLLILALFIGVLSAALAVWPNLILPGSGVPFRIIPGILAILINGIFWIALLSWSSLKSRDILNSLRN